jgi:hypothetical protein
MINDFIQMLYVTIEKVVAELKTNFAMMSASQQELNVVFQKKEKASDLTITSEKKVQPKLEL